VLTLDHPASFILTRPKKACAAVVTATVAGFCLNSFVLGRQIQDEPGKVGLRVDQVSGILVGVRNPNQKITMSGVKPDSGS